MICAYIGKKNHLLVLKTVSTRKVVAKAINWLPPRHCNRLVGFLLLEMDVKITS